MHIRMYVHTHVHTHDTHTQLTDGCAREPTNNDESTGREVGVTSRLSHGVIRGEVTSTSTSAEQ